MLVEVELPQTTVAMPPEVRRLTAEAEARIDAHLQQSPASEHGFVASDFVAVYQALYQIREARLATGHSFCEWGSGFGVVTLLAALLDYNACGIEIDPALVDAAQQLADHFAIDAEFVHGSFIPPGAQELVEHHYDAGGNDFHWLVTDSDDAYQQLELDPVDFDIIFAYPWPNEQAAVEKLFEQHAASGALLLMYGHLESMRLLRKS